jgi:hypothetical protein
MSCWLACDRAGLFVRSLDRRGVPFHILARLAEFLTLPIGLLRNLIHFGFDRRDGVANEVLRGAAGDQSGQAQQGEKRCVPHRNFLQEKHYRQIFTAKL